MSDSCPSKKNGTAGGGYLGYLVCSGVLAFFLFGCGEKQDASSPSGKAADATPQATDAPPVKSTVRSEFEPSTGDLTQHNRAVAQMGQFQFEAARAGFEQLVKKHPQWLAVRIDLGIATLNRQQPGDSEQAEQIFDKVLQEDPTRLRARHCRGILKLHRGDSESALEDFQYVAQRDPTDAYAAYFSGSCFFELAQFEQAKQQFATARRIDPYLRSAYYGAMQAAQRLGLKEEVGQLLSDFKKLGSNPQAHLAEIKYTRMGPKAEVLATNLVREVDSSTVPEGPLFQSLQLLAVENASSPLWRQPVGPDEIRPRPSTTVCDVDADGDLDLLFASSLSGKQNQYNAVLFAVGDKASAGRDVSYRLDLEHPLTSIDNVEAALWGDFDNDGLADVYLCRRGPNQLWRQVAAGQWEDVTEATRTSGGEIGTVGGVFFDADHDGDLDLFLVNAGAPNELLSNNLDGTFRSLGESQGIAGEVSDSRGVLAVDLDGDRDRDLVVINASTPHEVFLNDRLWDYRRAENFGQFIQTTCEAAVAADLDADGQVEIITLAGNELLHWEPNDLGQWSSRTLVRVPRENETDVPGRLELADVDGDGRLEAIVSDAGRCWVVSTAGDDRILFKVDDSADTGWQVAMLDPRRGAALVGFRWSEGPVGLLPSSGRHPYLVVDFTGLDNKAKQMRSNRSGIGIQGAARIGSRWTAFDSLPSTTATGQSLQPVVLGLGGAERADFLSILWPDGVLQTEVDLSTEKIHSVEETQRQLASCPVVFVWNGQQFDFVTDILGVGGLGFNLARGEYSEPRPWENLLLPDDLLKPRDGKFEIKIGEPMEEVCYLDSARLVAYDLPPGWEMTLDERLATGDPQPTGQPFFYQQQLIPSRAINERSEEVTAQLRLVDHESAPPGRLDHRFLGRTELQTLEIEFDKPLESLLTDDVASPKGQLVLVFHGWIEYPYSQTMFAAWQAGAEYASPTLEARDASGNWHVVLEQFGYMAGMPRSAAVPIGGLPARCNALRLTTSCEIYWDQIKVAAAVDCPEAVRHVLPLHAARLSESGFAYRTTRSDRLPDYDYQQRSPLWDTRHMAGFYTAFGDALPLVDQVDDAVAIFGPGEEVHLEYEALAEPPLQGWTRRYVLESFGWCKDMDLYTKDGERVGPLPVRDTASGATTDPSGRQLLHEQFNRRYRDGP